LQERYGHSSATLYAYDEGLAALRSARSRVMRSR
jgi:hypothetical protein